MNNILKEFNNQNGRFNRYKFWFYIIVLNISIWFIGFLIGYIGGKINIVFISEISPLIIGLGVMYVGFTAYIKRLHDLDKSGLMSLLILVPIANIYLIIICGFIKGTNGPNKYGPDPLGNTQDKIGEQKKDNSIPNEL